MSESPLIQFYKSKPDYESNTEILISLAGAYCFDGDNAQAIIYLKKAIELGFDKESSLLSNTNLNALKALPEWKDIIVLVKENWDKKRNERHQTALKKKLLRKAPVWQLKDINNENFSLAELPGKVVLLDFGSSWCPTCIKFLPILEKLAKKYKESELTICCLCVREKNTSDARDYILGKSIGSRLIFLPGNTEVTEKYGVTSIPHYFLLDSDLNIRYEDLNCDDKTEEQLLWWIDDLLGKK